MWEDNAALDFEIRRKQQGTKRYRQLGCHAHIQKRILKKKNRH
jgi:hypothetical protein